MQESSARSGKEVSSFHVFTFELSVFGEPMEYTIMPLTAINGLLGHRRSCTGGAMTGQLQVAASTLFRTPPSENSTRIGADGASQREARQIVLPSNSAPYLRAVLQPLK